VIDKNALISAGAKIAKDVEIGPFTVIGPKVEIDSGTKIGSHVVIQGNTKIGKNNKIFHFVSLGAEPQSIRYKDEPTSLEIGNDNTIHEYASIHRGTVEGRGVTKIGNHNFLMAYTHIAHDCVLGNDIIMANNATLAGHVTVGNFVGFGGFVVVLQFCTFGDYCFIAGNTGIIKDVLPYVLVSAQHGTVKTYGLNVIGLKRRGFTKETLQCLKHAYKIISRKDLTIRQIIPELEIMQTTCPEVKRFIEMLKNSKRGVIR
jgi:UDP-N-acetylglucosamine acyltransferase